MTTDNIKALLLLAGVAYVGYKGYQASKKVDKAIEIASVKLNPASNQNVIYTGTQSIGKSIADWLNPVTKSEFL